MNIFLSVCFFLFFVSPSYAQTKPIGIYSPGVEITSSPFSFGPIGDGASDEYIERAYQKSVSTGFLWILQMGYFDDPRIPANIVAERNLKKFKKLMPYVIAVMYGEEWYEHFNAGHFEHIGFPANYPDGKKLIYNWMSRQHALVKQVMNRPVIWLTNVVYSEQPVPKNTDFVAIDAYSADDDEASLRWAETRLLYAEVATDLPLVVIPRWFRVTGNKQGPGWENFTKEPSRESLDLYFRILGRSRYVAMLGFLFESRPNSDLVGLKDMPSTYNYVLSKIKESNK